MIRHLSPTDIPLLILRGGSFQNEARTKDNLDRKSASPPTIMAFLEPWLVPKRERCSWVYTHGGGVCSFVSARRRGRAVWEVDHLVLRNECEESACLDPLIRLSREGRDLGVEKIFLRLFVDSPMADTARHAGFHSYLSETLYRLQGHGSGARSGEPASGCTIRQKRAEDEYRAFELYNATVPASVKMVEGLNFEEWRRGREGLAIRWRKTEFVCEKEGCLAAWFRLAAAGNVGQFEVVAHLEDEGELEWLLEYGFSLLGACNCIYCLVPEFQESVARILKSWGGEETDKYIVLVKQLAVPVRKPDLVPAQA